MGKYLVIIPAYNEEETISDVIRETKTSLPFSDIVVVNDGSTDRTAEISFISGAEVLNMPFNAGYGAAVQTGFRYALEHGYDYVITIDGDGQHVPDSSASLISVMSETNADVVIGSRFLGGGYRMDKMRLLGVRLFSAIARLITGMTFTDPTSGFQLINRRVFSYLAQGDNYPLDYPDVNIIIALHRMRFKMAEAPVLMREKPNGRSMHSGIRPVIYVIRMFLSILVILLRREH